MKTLATIIEADGAEREESIEWDIDTLRSLMGGDFRIVATCPKGHIIETEFWHARGMTQNMTASVKYGRALHGRIIIAKEPHL